MATNAEILNELSIMKKSNETHEEKTDRVLIVAEKNRDILRGENGQIGFVARVVRLEDITKWLYSLIGLAALTVIVDKLVEWVKPLFN